VSAFDVEGVSMLYAATGGPPIPALDDVQLKVAQNEFVSLLGPSGCGKSTLLRIMAALLRPSLGTVRCGEAPLRAPTPAIGFVFQDSVLLPWRNVIDNVLLPVETQHLGRAAHLDPARQLLALVGLEGFEKRMPHELSGGMRQRVALCRGLITKPAALLMDEPFAALDAMTREELGFELLRIWEQQKTTIIFVTHSVSEAILLSDRVVVMTRRPGRIARIVPIDLARPRTLAMQFTPAFEAYSEAIRSSIEIR
jgi:NitT/TauT family transport system ATP-binding protein